MATIMVGTTMVVSRARRLRALGLISLFLFSFDVFAQSPDPAQTSFVEGKKYAVVPKWSASLSLSYARSVTAPADSFYSETASAEAKLGRPLPWDLTLGIGAGFIQEIDGLRESTVTPAYAGVSRKFFETADESFYTGLNVRAIFPTNRQSAEHTSFQGGASISPSLNWKLDEISWGHLAEFGAAVAYRENLYQYDADDFGSPNLARTYVIGLSAKYSWHPKWSLAGSFGQTFAQDTNNDVIDDIYSNEQTLSYSPDGKFSVGVGHILEDQTLQYDRVAPNVKVMDRALSKVYTEVGYAF